MYGYIYLTTNLINNMIYVGQHKSKVFDQNYFGSGKLVSRALKLYGKQNFSVEILEWCETQEKADQLEKKYILQYHLPDINIGYNLTHGGQAKFFTGMHHTEATKQLISKKTKGKSQPPTTSNYVWLTDGKTDIFVNSIKALELLTSNNNYINGRTNNCDAWNKGLNKENNKILQQISSTRKEKIQNGEIRCCYGLKGSDSPNYLSAEEMLNNINAEEFINFWRENGKCKTAQKYHMRTSTVVRLLEYLNIFETKEYKKYIYNKSKNKK